ncbi:MAG: hypothetical protein J3Q66DRAFT_335504 [Benniella sp.]|nr:MAG: hypothetical protein J3Q66DRAFT_335504 [Benniella sp.]
MRYQLNSPRKVIAVDLDEVLARTSLAIADFHNDTYGTSLTMDDFISYDFTKVWGGTREESIAKWRLFFDSPYFHKVEPVEGSLETLKLLKSRRYSLVIVTARQQFVADLTKKFVDRHFPGIFESIYFANHFLTEEEKLSFVSKPKSVICRDVHAQLLIDDSLENALEVAKAGIPVLLFDLHGNYKWNKIPDDHPPLPDKITRVKNWKEIQAWFPRPRSPLSNLCLSRDDPISEDEEEEEEEGEEEESSSESSDGSDYEDVGKYEEDGEHQGETLRRRKLMMMDFSSSEEEEDVELEHGENMDSDEQDFDLETGHGCRRRRHISHEILEQYGHQQEAVYTRDEDSMEMETDVTNAKSTSMTETTTFTQLNGDILHGGMVSVATATTTATTTIATATGLSCTTADQVSIAAVQVESQPSDCSMIPAMAVEGLTMQLLQADKRNMEMEEVPLA